MWSGDYKNWTEATKHVKENDDSFVLEKSKEALLKVKNGEAAYERDGVLFQEHNYSWGVLAGLQKAALENGNKLCVIDFGGSLGRCFYQNIPFLKNIEDVEWCVIEQKKFVMTGKKHFEDKNLKFYQSIEEALQYHEPNVLLLSSVVNYLEYAYKWVDQFNNLKIPYVLVDRTSFTKREKDIIAIQDSEKKESSLPYWFFNESKFINGFSNYQKLGSFPVEDLPEMVINDNEAVCWKGFVFQLK